MWERIIFLAIGGVLGYLLFLLWDGFKFRRHVKQFEAKRDYHAAMEQVRQKATLKQKKKEFEELEKRVESEKDYRKKLELVMRFLDEHLQD